MKLTAWNASVDQSSHGGNGRFWYVLVIIRPQWPCNKMPVNRFELGDTCWNVARCVSVESSRMTNCAHYVQRFVLERDPTPSDMREIITGVITCLPCSQFTSNASFAQKTYVHELVYLIWNFQSRKLRTIFPPRRVVYGYYFSSFRILALCENQVSSFIVIVLGTRVKEPLIIYFPLYGETCPKAAKKNTLVSRKNCTRVLLPTPAVSSVPERSALRFRTSMFWNSRFRVLSIMVIIIRSVSRWSFHLSVRRACSFMSTLYTLFLFTFL